MEYQLFIKKLQGPTATSMNPFQMTVPTLPYGRTGNMSTSEPTTDALLLSTTIATMSIRDFSHVPILALRLATLAIVVIGLYVHLRTLRVFRWEHTVSGGLLVTYCISALGLALAAGNTKNNIILFQAYLCGVGAALFTLNAVVLWRQWQRASDLTRVVAELLDALGVPLGKQVLIKVSLSAAASISLLADLIFSPLMARIRVPIPGAHRNVTLLI